MITLKYYICSYAFMYIYTLVTSYLGLLTQKIFRHIHTLVSRIQTVFFHFYLWWQKKGLVTYLRFCVVESTDLWGVDSVKKEVLNEQHL